MTMKEEKRSTFAAKKHISEKASKQLAKNKKPH